MSHHHNGEFDHEARRQFPWTVVTALAGILAVGATIFFSYLDRVRLNAALTEQVKNMVERQNEDRANQQAFQKKTGDDITAIRETMGKLDGKLETVLHTTVRTKEADGN